MALPRLTAVVVTTLVRCLLEIPVGLARLSRASETQETLGVAVRDAILIGGAERELLQEIASGQHGAIGVVRREHDPLDPDLKQQVEEIWSVVETAEGVVEVLAQVSADRALQFGELRGQIVIKPRQHERKGFAEVADHQLQIWVAVKCSTEDDAEDMDGGLNVPTPA